MLFRSTNSNAAPVTFNEAVLSGIAPDGGLWTPESLPRLDSVFLSRLPDLSLQEIGLEMLNKFTEDAIPNDIMRAIIDQAFSMKAPVVQLSDSLFVLELFHGP